MGQLCGNEETNKKIQKSVKLHKVLLSELFKYKKPDENFSDFIRTALKEEIAKRKFPIESNIPRYKSLIDANEILKIIGKKLEESFTFIMPKDAQRALSAMSASRQQQVKHYVDDYCQLFDNNFVLKFFEKNDALRFTVEMLDEYEFLSPHFSKLNNQLKSDNWTDSYRELMDFVIMLTK